MTAPPDNPPDHDQVEQLLEASLAQRGRRLPPRERRVEIAVSALFLLALAAWLALTRPHVSADPLVVALVAAYALAMRVGYPVGSVSAVPTQLFVVPLFAVAGAALVPALVFAAIVLSTTAGCVTRRARWDRLLFAGGDALHSFGPAVVLVATGHTVGLDAPWPLLLVALVAQCATDFVATSVRQWLISGVRPGLQVRVLGQVWAVDAAMTSLGLLAVHAQDDWRWAPLAQLPLVALVAYSARDRTERTTRLHARLEALKRERRRLQIAVRRIGDAFASNLDLDALLEIVTRAAVDALDADGGRGSFPRPGRPLARASVEGPPALEELIDVAQRSALTEAAACEVGGDGAWALACPMLVEGRSAAVVTVARSGEPFAPEERDLLAYLCERAAVSAANVAHHHAVQRQALTDELTGLANHRRLQELLGTAVNDYELTGEPAALLLLDLDDFKRVNDRHGHQAGDLVLQAVGRCLRRHCRPDDEPARYGGEELAVLLPATDAEGAAAFAERLRRGIAELELSTPDGQGLHVTVSIGLATLGGGTSTKTALIAAADRALYAAKANGKDCVRMGGETAGAGSHITSATGTADLLEELRDALAAGQFELHYQPKVRLDDGSVGGVEALVRWHHPQRGLLGPGAFVPVMENSELMPLLTRWALGEAVGQSARWAARGVRLPVAVNICAQDLADPGFAAGVADVLAGAGLPAGLLRLEITEHSVIADAIGATAALEEVRALGVGISLDDFGTGHSSLTRLGRLPVDELKLDRGFLRSQRAGSDLAVLRAALSLGHDLGLAIVAEGIEDEHAWRLLSGMGCQYAQGFYIAPPLRAGEVERWIQEWAPPRPRAGPSPRLPDRHRAPRPAQQPTMTNPGRPIGEPTDGRAAA